MLCRSIVFSAVSLFLFRFVPLSSLHAQELSAWENMTQLPGRSLIDFWPGDSVLCVKDMRGQLLLTRNAGATWEPTGLLVEDLHIGHDGSLVVITSGWEIMYSPDNGRTFERVADGLIPTTTSIQLFGDGNYVYIVRYSDAEATLFRSSDGGRTWHEIDSLPGQSMDYAVGPDGALYSLKLLQDSVMRCGVGVNTWSLALRASEDLLSIRFGRDGRLYAVSVRDSLFKSDLDVTEFKLHIFPFDHTPDFIVNRNGEVYQEVAEGPVTRFLRYSADGTRQEEVATNLSYVREEFHLRFGRLDQLWLIGGKYGAFLFDSIVCGIGHDFGPLVFPGHGSVQRLERTPNGDWLLLANNRAYHSNNEGESIIPMNLPDHVIAGSDHIGYIDSTTIALFSNAAGYTSMDFGNTWEQGGVFRPNFHRAENGTLFAVGGTSPDKSTDKGATWTRIAALRPVIHHITSRGGNIVAVGNRNIYRSSDWGETWDTMENESLPSLVTTSAITAEGVFVGGFGLIDSSILGNPYYVTISPDDTAKVVRQLPCDDLNTQYLFASDPAGRPYLAMACGLFRSDDEGVSWKKIAEMPEGRQPTALLINDAETFFLGTNEGLFKAQRISSVEAVTGSDAAAGRVTITAAPNPIRSESRIGFVLSSASHVNINLFDPLGRHVAHIVQGDFSAGGHSVSWGLPGELAAGSYVLAIEASGESVTQSIVVLPD